jgi:Kef-type K+ transport system membrane component KefB
MDDLNLHVASTFGILLGTSLLAGIVAEYIRLPKVTAFLLAGLALGPSGIGLIPTNHGDASNEHVSSEADHGDELSITAATTASGSEESEPPPVSSSHGESPFDPMLKLAMGLVLFGLGSQFPLRRIRQIVPRAMALATGDLIGTFLVVTIGLMILGQGGRVSLLLGCLALATAPATTILVFRDLRSDGPITEQAGVLVALNNLAAIIAFELAFLAMQVMDGGVSTSIPHEVGGLALCIGGAIALGSFGGLLVSLGCGLLHPRRWLALLVASTTLVLGFAESAEMPYMLTFMVMGLTVANLSDMVGRIRDELNQLTGLLSVLFFAVHGSELDIHAFFAAGMIGGAYIILRSVGKCGGVMVAARLTKQPDEVQRWLGPTLLAQAGAAIALSGIAATRMPELGRPVQAIILGSVVVFEIIGPLLIRKSVIEAGEVPIASAIHHRSASPIEELRDMWDSLRQELGWVLASKVAASDLTIEPLIHRAVSGINESAHFDDVVTYIEHSHDNAYPVVNAEREVVGLIRYQQLREVMFDPSITELVCAADLAAPTDALLHPDDSVEKASKLFQSVPDDLLPVVARTTPHTLVGVVRRSDVTHVLIRRHERSTQPPTDA